MDFEMAWAHWQKEGYDIYDLGHFGEAYERLITAHHSDNGFSESDDDLFNAGVKALYLNDKDCFKVAHIGLTMDQIRELNPPPNPAKMTDPRAAGYISEFGRVSWEVDAIDPQELDRMVREAIEADIDMDLFQEMLEREQSERHALESIANEY